MGSREQFSAFPFHFSKDPKKLQMPDFEVLYTHVFALFSAKIASTAYNV